MRDRPAVRHMAYPGNVEHIVGEIKGPNTMNEMWTAVVAEYDPRLGSTTVGFAPTELGDYPNAPTPDNGTDP